MNENENTTFDPAAQIEAYADLLATGSIDLFVVVNTRAGLVPMVHCTWNNPETGEAELLYRLF